MKNYDIIVIGSGAGAALANAAINHRFKTALIDKGPVGGTCLNLGCIPSKMLIFPADRIMEIRDARKLGIAAEIRSVDFEGIMTRVMDSVTHDRETMRSRLSRVPGLDFYEHHARFVDEFMLSVNGKNLKGDKIVIASGARPLIPSIPGLEYCDYLTNESVLDLKKKPESLIIIGGGYIAAEYGHFFSAMGTRVSIVQRGKRILKEEEPEISAMLEEQMGKRMDIYTGMEVTEALPGENSCGIIAQAVDTGETLKLKAEKLMVAAGRTSNADLLEVQNTGVQTDKNGYILVDDYLETTQKGIYALGDAVGRQMFRHAANYEASLVWENAVHGERIKMDYRKVPHGVFSYPQIASVGFTEASARKQVEDVLVGTARYRDVAMGDAMMEENGFAKAVVQKNTGNILGFHIIGPHAAILLQEVVNAMTTVETVVPILRGMHIHPALSELIQSTLENLHEPEENDEDQSRSP